MKIRILKEMVSKAIVTRGGKILLLKRADKYITEKNYWTWDIPGGHVESGESPEDAAKRETLEETGLALGLISYMGKDSNIGKLTHFYKATSDSGDVTLSDEHTKYEWVNSENLEKYREGVGQMYYKMILKAL